MEARDPVVNIDDVKLIELYLQQLQEAFCDNCLRRSRYHDWYRRFNEGRASAEDDHR